MKPMGGIPDATRLADKRGHSLLWQKRACECFRCGLTGSLDEDGNPRGEVFAKDCDR